MTILLRTITTLCALMVLSTGSSARAEDFVATTLRAAPGQLATLIEEVRAYRAEQRGRVIVMRHSQGDHWDLMLLEPTGDNPMSQPDFSSRADFQQSFLVTSGATFKGLSHRANNSGLYHVEMFQARAGKRDALLDQRRRENEYLAATGQVVNAVFTTSFGSDVDVFTLGFHQSLASMAQGPTVSDAEAEAAAKTAGFKSREDIGLFLRSLIVSHQDTLAVPVD